MLILGHTGITLGVATLLAGVLGNSRCHETTRNEVIESTPHHPQVIQNRKALWLTLLASRIDIRLLLVGSLLPDIIDKPVGQFFFRETFSNGRIFCHTLLFLILVTIAGIYLYRRHSKTWFLFLSLGTFMHLILDQMWRAPRTLLWPILGLEFDRIDLTEWIGGLWQSLVADPTVYISELVGLFIILWFLWMLIRMRTFYSFAIYGRVR